MKRILGFILLFLFFPLIGFVTGAIVPGESCLLGLLYGSIVDLAFIIVALFFLLVVWLTNPEIFK